MTTRRGRATARQVRDAAIDNLIDRAERGHLTHSDAVRLRQLMAESRRIAAETARSLGGVQSQNQALTARLKTAEAAVQRLADLADYWAGDIGGQRGECVRAAMTAVATGTHPPLPGATPWAWGLADDTKNGHRGGSDGPTGRRTDDGPSGVARGRQAGAQGFTAPPAPVAAPEVQQAFADQPDHT